MSRPPEPHDLDALYKRVEHAARSNPREALRLVQGAMARLGPSRSTEARLARARLHRYRGHALRALNDFAGATLDYNRALALFRRAGNSTEAAVTQIGRIDALMYRSRYGEALAAARAARRVLAARGDMTRVARLDTNTGNLFHRWDRPAAALKYYDRAGGIFRRLSDPFGEAVVSGNRGNVLAGLGRLEESRAAFQTARRIFAGLGMDLAAAEASYGIAYLLLLQDRLTEAIHALQELEPVLESLGERRILALCGMDGAEAYLKLHLWIEAHARARQAAQAFRVLDMRYEEARSLAFEGVALMKSGRPDAALAAWRRARAIFEREGNRAWHGVVLLNMARLQWDRRRTGQGLKLARQALKHLDPSAPPDRRAEALSLLGRMEGAAARTAAGRAAAARRLGEARRLARSAQASWLVRDIEEALGDLARRSGHNGEARRRYTAAVEAGERLRSLLHGDEFRAAFFRDRARPYLALADLEMTAGRVEKAFGWVERGRARALLEGLEGLPRRRRSRRAPEEARELEVLLRRLAVQYQQDSLAGGLSAARPASGTARLPDAVRRHLESRAESLIGALYPECAPRDGIDRRPSPQPATRFHLRPEEALLSFCEIDGSITAFVETTGGISAATDLAGVGQVTEAAERLAYQWGRFRLGAELQARHGRLLLADAIEDLHLLHGLLVAPLASARDRTRWIVIPSRSMASIPFAALHDGHRFAIETHQVVTSPSVGVLVRCHGRLARRAAGTLVVGVGGPDAPEVAAEVAAVSRLAARRPVDRLAGPQATVEAVARRASGKAVIHLASHGFFHSERPRLSGVRLADRWLHAHDAARLDLSAGLVVLSACQSGTSQVLEGDEWMGLPRAFLTAGAARVVASLWDVDDRATRRLMTRFTAACGKRIGGPAQALQSAQYSLLRETPHPYFWAAFQILGAP